MWPRQTGFRGTAVKRNHGFYAGRAEGLSGVCGRGVLGIVSGGQGKYAGNLCPKSRWFPGRNSGHREPLSLPDRSGIRRTVPAGDRGEYFRTRNRIQKILEQMDLESYLDYYCANLYFGNSQFDSFSTTLWRRAGEGETGKWHWEFSDATDTLGRNKVSNYSVNTYLCPGVAEDLFLQGLLKNKDFQTAFRQRMREYVEELTKEKAEEYLTPLLETYRVAVTATAERYGLRQTEEGYLADGMTIQEYFASRGE